MQNFHKDGTCNRCHFSGCPCGGTDTWYTTGTNTIFCDCCKTSEPLTDEECKVLSENENLPEGR